MFFPAFVWTTVSLSWWPIASAAFLLFASFAWAIRWHFVQAGPTATGMKLIAVLGFVFLAGQHAWLWNQPIPVAGAACSTLLYAASTSLFRGALAATQRRGFGLAFSGVTPGSLVMTGPYRSIRHPFYTSYLLFWLAPFAALPSLWLLLPPLVMYVIYSRAALWEEQLLCAGDLGETYRVYQSRTGRFLPRLRSKPLVVREAQTPAERTELIALRTEIYRQAAKHEASGAMVDTFDADAILVGVWRAGRAVATARILCRRPDEEWEHDRFLVWRPDFPARADTVEVSRFCISPRERSWEVVYALSAGIVRAALVTGRSHILACCTTSLCGFYRSFFVARFTGDVIRHSDLGRLPHHVFFSPYQAGLMGAGLGLLPWLSLWPSAAAWGLRKRHVGQRMSPWSRSAWHLFLLAASVVCPLARWLMQASSNLRRRWRRASAT
jgi:protein-S-isoprenylcysteine O-methyltransferase Ste14/N-acyl-L-homoserine lactone synthetase